MSDDASDAVVTKTEETAAPTAINDPIEAEEAKPAAPADALSTDESELLKQVPIDGSPIGNKSLRELLKWDTGKYWPVRDKLVNRGLITLGRGRGGSVSKQLTIPAAQSAAPSTVAPQGAEQKKREEDYYDKLKETLENVWAKDTGLETCFVQNTAKQGRRDTGGKWSRPDLAAVNVASYEHLPGKYLDVISFEVKLAEGLDITAVYEALSHRKAATKSYLLIVGDITQDEALASAIEAESNRHGIGVIIVPEDVEQYEKWQFRIEPEASQPDPAILDEFLETQLTDENKKRLRKAVK